MSRTTTVLIAVAGLTLFAPPAGAKERERTITIHARSQVEQAHLVDNAPAGDSAGDVLLFTERLLDRRGKRIGSDAATCVRLFDAASLCTGTYKLPGGRLMVQLLHPGPGVTYDQAITGGTRRFAGARGTVRVVQKPGGSDRFTFKVRVTR
jgi:hypothetical protein